MKRLSKLVFHKAVLILTFVSLTGASSVKGPRIFPTGVTLYNPEKAYNNFVLFTSSDGITRLIDMNGNDVHQWPYAGQPPELLDPAVSGGKLGHVLLQLKNGSGSFDNKAIAEFDWEGKIVWEWAEKAPGGEAQQHHDIYRLSNGNTVVLAHKKSTLYGYNNITDDVIYEVTQGGDIHWKWISTEHIDEFGFTEESLKYLKKRQLQAHEAGRPFDYLHINAMHVLGDNQWYQDGDKRFHPDNIIFDSRNGNFVAIIDKQSGKIVWRLGPEFPESSTVGPGTSLPRTADQISGQHDAHLIAEGLPGEGNLLLFDNQGSAGYPPVSTRSYSRVLEIDPLTQKIVWEYTGGQSGRTDRSFFSSFISNARRLPNGNTLINEGMNGRIFQVTPSGEIVWEYVSPYSKITKEDEAKTFNNQIYRAQPVPYHWVPKDTPRSEKAVKEPDVMKYKVLG